ncbi:recombinase family protein [Sphingomonadaceae bacterium G21617-S1]|nr:recombinase family protein [Sphingomonadaceae bacterium G21617-S1]
MKGSGQLIRAAQYVRMSTDHQRYSTTNQRDAIALYALHHGFEVVRTYADEGRTGLNLSGRSGLQALLRDVLSKDREFEAILAYDVSRWGRFQDTDEGAHYEFLCRSNGVPIHYCAEQFSNDGSMASSILKNVKRVMAGEYSRELSAKVYAGQARLVKMGYHMGGRAPYGFRRVNRPAILTPYRADRRSKLTP